MDENIGDQKLIKVRIKGTVTNFIVGSKTYLPGDVVEVPEENFSPNFMERIDKPKIEPKPKPEPVEPQILPPEEEPQAELLMATEPVEEEKPQVKPDVKRVPAIEPKVKKVRRAKKKWIS